jgi:uncharacterized coiled-coil protein SlyX
MSITENMMDTSITGCNCSFQQLRPLESDVEEYDGCNDTLACEQNEQSFNQKIALVKGIENEEMLLRKTKELQERDHKIEVQSRTIETQNKTIETQNALLGYAWAKSQEQEKRIKDLYKQMEEVASDRSPDCAYLNINKKRKLAP